LAIPPKKSSENIQGYCGELTWISINSVPLGPSEKPTGVIVTAVDITDRRQLEHVLNDNNEELRRAKSIAEKANLAKSDFLSSMSHELRSPMNAVLGFAQLIESGTPPPSASQMRSTHQILQAGGHLLDMINGILDLSTIESSTVTMSQESVSLREVWQDCLSMVGPQAQQRGLAMAIPGFEQIHHVLADRTRLKQVLLNLLSNAIKYNQAGGSVVVQCVATGNDRRRLSVSNTDAGLTPEQVDQLFQPFNRLGREGGTEQGTGIGLVVTKKMVELMGGTIGAESSVGVGSVFWVEFTASRQPETACTQNNHSVPDLPLQDATHMALPLRTLLCVEDNPANLLLIEELIGRRSDLKLSTAIDAELGIKMAIAYRPDTILMDINLSGMDGFGALQVLREEPATAHIPVMALSASATARDIARGLEAGFFRYLTKPIHVQEFMDSIDFALLYAAENAVARAEVTA
jgi:signal transduction histidine kinase/ActR/RegA family two-component response regulator